MPEVRCEQTDGVTVGRGDSFAHCGSFSCRAKIYVFVHTRSPHAQSVVGRGSIFGVVAADSRIGMAQWWLNGKRPWAHHPSQVKCKLHTRTDQDLTATFMKFENPQMSFTTTKTTH
jgi:hypothetical protein